MKYLSFQRSKRINYFQSLLLKIGVLCRGNFSLGLMPFVIEDGGGGVINRREQRQLLCCILLCSRSELMLS
ncbi:hypothetical protein C3E98_036945, partial [Pseudomonas sp. MWU13-2625]